MTLVRVAANRVEAMSALVAQGNEVRLGGELARILPLSHIRQAAHRSPPDDEQANRLHSTMGGADGG